MANDKNFKVKNGLDVSGSITTGNLYITDTNTRVHEGSGNSIRLTTNEGYIELGPQNSGWAHIQSNKNFYFNRQISVDGNLQPYNTSGARTLGASNALWGHVHAVNTTLTGYLRGPSTFTIDPAAHGDDTGTVVIAGNLQVDGTTTTVNSTTVAVSDLNFTVAKDAANASAANGAGLTVAGASAELKYIAVGDKWTMNKPLDVTGNLDVTGKLGVGITPVEVLDLKSASGDTRIRLDAVSGSDTEVKFFNAGVAQYTIGHDDATDNFVIGTTNVDAPLVSINKSGVATFAKSVYGAENSENYFRIKLQDVGGVHNDVGIGQTQSGNMGFNVTDGQEFIFNLGTSGHAAWINSAGVDAKVGGFRINGTTVISSGRVITGSSFTDGYITWGAAQLNRYGAAIELQYTPTNSATLVKIGANGSNPTTFNAYTGDATFSGTISATGGSSTNWNTAYGWGNHASGGYLAASHDMTVTLTGDVTGTAVHTNMGTATISTVVANDSHNHTTLHYSDNRTISPNELSANKLRFGFTSWANNNTSPYADYLHFRSYTDASGGKDNLLMFKKSSKGMRLWQQTFGSATAYSSYVDIWDTGTLTTTNKANYDTAYGWGNHGTQSYATQSYVGTQISNLVDSSPAALNTLNELAAALGDDASFSTTVTNSIATKLPKAGGTMTGVLTINHTNDNQLLLTSPSSWTGIGFNDSAAGGTEYLWYNGTYGTFALGGGGSNVSGKKLHVDGGMTIGSGYDATAVSANSLVVQGTISSADHIITSGTSGSNTTGIVFKTTDNSDAQKWIKQTAYYMQYNGHGNEGHRFTTNGTTDLLRIHGSTNGTRPNSVNVTASNGLYVNNVQVIDSSRNITNIGTVASTHFLSTANLNSSGDGGVLIISGSRLGFDQSGTRSWTMKATGGNLSVYSGDGNGLFTTAMGITSGGAITSADFFKATGSNLKFSAGGNHIFNVDLNGKIYPQTHNAVDLGFSTSLAFRKLYLTSTIEAGGTISTPNVSVVAGDHNGIGFWGGTTGGTGSYAMYMSSVGGSQAGRVAGETTSDYNMYFKMSAGTNRGFVFKNGGTALAGIDASGTGRFTGSLTAADNIIAEGHIGQGPVAYPKRVSPMVQWSASGATTGKVIIDLPGDLTSHDMLYMEIEVYEYSSHNASKIIIGGHNWNSGGNSGTSNTMWHNTGVKIIGEFNKEIYFGWRNDGSNNRRCIILGSNTSSWSYGQVHVSAVKGAGSYYTTGMDYMGNWGIAQSTSSVTYTASPTTNFNGTDSRTMKGYGAGQWGRVYGNTDIRSPIFYDLDNTGYYANPAGTSNFTRIDATNHYGTEFYSSSWFRNSSSGTGLYNSATGQHFWSDDDDYWNIGGGTGANGLRFRDEHNGTIRGYVYADNGNNVGLLDNAGGWKLRIVGGDYGLFNGSSARAPIFYDSNDTGYYGNFADTTTSITVKGAIQLTTSSGSNRGFIKAVETGGGTTAGLVVATSGGEHITFKDNGVSGDVNFYLDGSGNSFSTTSSRAPIFYDSNNTAYYGDFSATGTSIKAAGITDSKAGFKSTANPWNTSDSAYFPNGITTPTTTNWIYGHTYLGGAPSNGSGNEATAAGTFESTSWHKATSYIDRNNTAYYCDPNSTSVLNAITLNGQLIGDTPMDYDGTAITSMTSAPFKLPNVNVGTTNTFLPFGHMSSQYSSGYITHLNFGLYKLASGWGDQNTGFYVGLGGSDSNPTKYWKMTYGTELFNSDGYVSQSGSFRAPIFYDKDNTAYYVNPNSLSRLENLSVNGGNENTGGANNSVVGLVMRSGAYNTTQNTWATKFHKMDHGGGVPLYLSETISTAAWSGIQRWGTYTGNTYKSQIFGTFAVDTAVYTPKVYDKDNTAYYGDFASNTHLNTLSTAGAITVGNTTSSDIYMTDTDEGTRRIHCNSNNIGFLNSSNGWGSYCTDSGDWQTNFISYASASMRTPIFYDNNNTNYYGDFASSGTALRIAGDILCDANYGKGMVGVYSSTVLQHVWSMGAAYRLAANGSTSGNLYGMAWSHPNAGSIGGANNLSDHGLLIINNGSFAAAISSRGVFSNDVRGTLFYDYNNTAYYVNPESSSDIGSRMRGGVLYGPNTSWSAYLYVGGNGNNQSYASVASTNGNLHLDGKAGYNVYLGWYTQNPTYVGGDLRAPLYYDRDNTGYYVNPASTSNVNTLSVAGSLTVGGSIVATGNITAYSDRRVKENIEPITNALNKVQQLNGVTFNRTDLDNKTKRYAGLIAQDIEAVLPEAVEGDTMKRVDYNATIGLLVEAIKELTAKVETLEKQLK